MLAIPQKTKTEIWSMLLSCELNQSRVIIADHELSDKFFTFWIEDKYDFKSTLNECVQVDIRTDQFKHIITQEGFNSYDGTKVHPTKKFAYKARITANEPIKWYNEDATTAQQHWVREAVMKQVLQEVMEREHQNA